MANMQDNKQLFKQPEKPFSFLIFKPKGNSIQFQIFNQIVGYMLTSLA